MGSPQTAPDRGWAWMVMVGSFGEHAVMGYCMYASGMIHIAFLEKFKASLLQTTWVSALFLAVISCSGPFASFLINRHSCRVAMIIGSLMMCAGVVLTAIVEDIKFTFITFGILAGIGLGICYNTGIIVIAFNFKRKGNMACGVAVSGAGIGPFILTPLYLLIYEAYGYTGYFLMLGGLALQNCVFGAIFRPSRIEIEFQLKNRNSTNERSIKKSFKSYFKVIRNASMTFLCVGFGLSNIGIFLIYIHFPEYCLHTSSTKFEVSLFLSIAGVSSCFGRFLFGMANNSHNIKEIIMIFGLFSVLGTSAILMPLGINSKAAKILFSSLLGAYSGSCYAVVNTVVMEIVGPEKIADGIGYLMVYVGIGTFLGPPLAGVIISSGGTFGISFVVAGILLICGGLSCLLSTAFKKSENTKELPTEDYELEVPLNEKTEYIQDNDNKNGEILIQT